MKKLLIAVLALKFFALPVAAQSTDAALTTQINTTIRPLTYDNKNAANMFKAIVDSKMSAVGTTFSFGLPSAGLGSRTLNVDGVLTDIALNINSKGTGNINIGIPSSTFIQLNTGGIDFTSSGTAFANFTSSLNSINTNLQLGFSSSAITSRGITTNGTNATVDLFLNPKGGAGVIIGNTSITNSSVLLDLQSTTRAFKLATAPRASITTPVNGMITVDANVPYFHNGTSWTSLLGGGGGITNTAANNELMLSNGTNAVPSSIFYSGSNLSIGTGTTGAVRALFSDGSETDVGLQINTKGSGNLTAYGNTTFIGSANYATVGVGPINIWANTSSLANSPGGNVSIRSGAGITGNANAGSITIFTDTPAGSGLQGSLKLQTNPVGLISFFNATPVVKQSAQTTVQGFYNTMVSYGLESSSTIDDLAVGANATDANITALINTSYYLGNGVITAPRNFIMPAGANNNEIQVTNDETTNVWNLTGSTVTDNNGTVTTLLARTSYTFKWRNGGWRVIN